MKNLLSTPLTFILFFLLIVPASAQTDSDQINRLVTQQDIEMNIYFLAADEFLGRDTGTQELEIAARYIATWFQVHGVEKPAGHDSYFQSVPLQYLTTPEQITFIVGEKEYKMAEHLIAMNGARGTLDAPLKVLEYGTRDEIESHDIEGKIVVTKAGLPGQSSPQQYFFSAQEKLEQIRKAGGAGLIELYSDQQIPWMFLVNFLSDDQLTLADDQDTNSEPIPHLWMNAIDNDVAEHLADHDDESVSLEVTGNEPQNIHSRNVVGVIKGTDPDLKHEYLMLGAHYDHIGVVDGHPEPITSEYIYNGARDNAVGTAGIMAAAKYFSKHPPKRSVILAAWTAEEKGLLGSRYYAQNPVVPIDQTIYKLNIDGAGYNDTTKVTVIGLGRTEADEEMITAAKQYSLEAIADPVPEQNLFDRSDNVSFAQLGVPAPTYSMGITAFDDEINKYYHQTPDEPHTLNYNYITSYIRSFVLAAGNIANRDEAPFWLSGDPYKEAGKELYGRNP